MQQQVIFNFDTNIVSGITKIAQKKGLPLNKVIETYLQQLIWKENLKQTKIEPSFYELIKQYNSINEPDLEITTIYNDRAQQNSREFIFD